MGIGFGSTKGVANTDLVTTQLIANFTTTIAIAFWANRNGAGGNNFGRVFFKVIQGGQTSVAYNDASSRWEFQCAFSSQAAVQFTMSGAATTAGVGNYHLIFYNGSATANTPVYFVDGISQTVTRTTAPAGTLLTTSDNPLAIGSRVGGDRVFNGIIDHLAIFYGNGKTATAFGINEAVTLASGIPPLFFANKGLVLFWPGTNASIEMCNGPCTVAGTKLYDGISLQLPSDE